MVALYHFNNDPKYDETTTNIFDFSGTGNNGTVYGAVNDSFFGKYSGAFHFDGQNDYIDIPYSSSLDNFNEFTVNFWMYPETLGGNRRFLVKDWAGGGGFDGTYLMSFHNSVPERIYFQTKNDGIVSYAAADIMSANEWYQVTFVYNGSGVSVFINGIKGSVADSASGIFSHQSSISISDSSNDFHGYFDELAIWNRTLNETEIYDIYNDDSPVSCTIIQYHRSDLDQDGCVETGEMVAFMDRWKVSSADVGMVELMESIGLWKAGTGCS
ncbi:MAG: LamG domain-containing protein [Gammaproteobacteria bacterium]|nr:LamG domain-containing protein [Gammaproteobacteria bacterium]